MSSSPDVSLFASDNKLVPNIYDIIVTQIHVQTYTAEYFIFDLDLDNPDDDDLLLFDDAEILTAVDNERNGDNHNKSSMDVVIFNTNDDIIAS